MLPAEDVFVHCHVLIDDGINEGMVQIPRRPGPSPACTDAEIITIAPVRHLLGRRSEAGFLAEIRREWPALFPSLPHPSEVDRRIRRLYGAYEQIRQALLTTIVADDRGQIDTSAPPVKHPSRVRGPDSPTGPNQLCARFTPRRRARRVVLRVPVGGAHRPGLAAGPFLGDRARGGQRT